MNEQEINCDRCGKPAEVEWIRICSTDGSDFRHPVRIWCATPDCVDDDGPPAVLPPPRPGELTREDRAWIRRHERLARE